MNNDKFPARGEAVLLIAATFCFWAFYLGALS